jgi:hypothetical protein
MRASRSRARSAPEHVDYHELPPSVARRRDFDSGSNIVPSRGEDQPAARAAARSCRASKMPIEAHPRAIAPIRATRCLKSQTASVASVRLCREGLRPDPDAVLRGPVGGELGALLLQLCRRVDGFPRHMGIHSGGMIITRDPLMNVAPIEWASMRDRTIVQWDKDDLSDLGLIKIDLLGLGMLSLLARCVRAPHALLSRTENALARIDPDRRQSRPTRCCAAPIRSACSKSSRARSSRCCRASSRCASTTS